MSSASDLYDQDFYAWALHNADLLRQGRLAEIDVANVAEELESMGGRERRELGSRLTELLWHLLKWRCQPKRRGGRWRTSIIRQRIGIVTDSP